MTTSQLIVVFLSKAKKPEMTFPMFYKTGRGDTALDYAIIHKKWIFSYVCRLGEGVAWLIV